MKHSMKWTFPVSLLLLLGLLAVPAMAAETALEPGEVYCFSPGDFQAEEGAGVLLTGVPAPEVGGMYLGLRQLRAGDVLPWSQLSELTFVPGDREGAEATVTCLRLTEQGPVEAAFTLKLGRSKNEPPTAEDSTFETYKNISGQVPLTVCDPEGEALTVTIVEAPKRGSVTVCEDGSVTYTPEENKVGKDAFVYTVTDPAGNVSGEATVRILIKKPSDRETYGDMTDDPDALAAVWLRENGLFSGETVSGQLLFGPDKTVSRGEFLAMCAALMGSDGAGEVVDSGFADTDETAAWLQPHVTAALRSGCLKGIPTANGLALLPDADVTQAQAVRLVSSILGLSQTGVEPVMALPGSVPAWASGAAAAMAQAELYRISDPDGALTRREAARMLYRAARYAEQSTSQTSLLSWAAK